MRSGVRLALVALWLPVLLANSLPNRSASAPRHPAADSLPRCYQLSFGPWTVGTEPLDLYRPLPEQLALTEELFSPGGDQPEYWGVRWPTDSLRRLAIWQRLGADTIAVRLPSWWSTGLWLTLTPRGDSLVGLAEVYADYSPRDPTFAAVVAAPTLCPILPKVGVG